MSTTNSNSRYEHHSQIGRKTALGLQIKFATKLFNYIALIFIIRYMGVATLGTIAYALAFISVFNLFTDMGTGFAHRKIATENFPIEECNSALIILKIILSTLMSFLSVSFIFYLKVTGYRFETDALEYIIYILLVDTFLRNMISMYRTLYGARLKIGAVSSYVVLGNFVSMLLRVSVSILGLSIIALAYSSLVASIIVVVIVTFLFFKNNQLKLPQKSLFSRYFRVALSVSILGIMSPLLFNIDKLMLGQFFGVEVVGYYSASEKIAGLLVLFTAALANQLLVIFSDYEAAGELSKIQTISQKSEKYISLSILPFIILIAISSEEILWLFYGPDFMKMDHVLIILSLSVYLNLIRTPHMMQILAGLHLKKSGALTVIAIMINFILNIFFIPDEFYGVKCLGLGILGAALASLTTMFLYGLMQRALSYRINGTLPHKGLLIQNISAAFSISVVLYLKMVFSNSLYLLIPYCLIGILTFFALLYVLKEFTKPDIMFFLNALGPSKMLKYIKEDMRDMQIRK